MIPSPAALTRLRATAAQGGGTPLLLLALLPPLLAVAFGEGVTLLPRLVLATALALGWQFVFAKVRERAPEPSGLVAALLIALLVPAEAPLWQLALGTSFGVVLGDLIFGGRGRSFVHPAVVALAFLMFSFSAPDYRAGPDIPFWSVLPALVVLLLCGIASWRLIATAAMAMALVLWAREVADPLDLLLSGPVLLALLFLGADPVASASTQAGRWVYGALLGLLAGLFAQAGPAFGAVVFAILMGSIFAPVIDQIVLALHMRWRERRHV